MRGRVERGIRTLRKPEWFPGIIIATGSEVSACREACDIIERSNIGVRLVNMPSWELFEEQSETYRNKILPIHCRIRVSVEAGCSMGWERYTGCQGVNMAIDRFGLSAPERELLSFFGFDPYSMRKRWKKPSSKIKHRRVIL